MKTLKKEKKLNGENNEKRISQNIAKGIEYETKKYLFNILVLCFLLLCFNGCTYAGAIKNETGAVITEVYHRNVGEERWGHIRNAGLMDTSAEHSPGRSSQVRQINNNQVSGLDGFKVDKPLPVYKDIRLVDSNGFRYTKLNARLEYDKFNFGNEDWRRGEGFTNPIVFTVNDRHPILTLINQTGLSVRITTPVNRVLEQGHRTTYPLPEPTSEKKVTINYSIVDYTFTNDVELNSDITFTLTERPPFLTVINNTGLPVSITQPFRQTLSNNESVVYPKQSRTTPPLHTIYYRSSTISYSEEVTINESDASLTLTKRPAIVTILNNSSATMVNVQVRPSGGAGAWDSINILSIQLNEDGTAVRRDIDGVTQYVTDLRGSIIHGDTFRFWMGNLDLGDGTYDIRVDDVHGMAYLKRNVHIASDIELNFTANDKL